MGAWHTPAHYAPVAALLASNGFPSVSCPVFASSGDSPTKTLYDDAAIICTELEKLVKTEEREVVVIAHSYGGIVATQAVHNTFTRTYREAAGLKGGVTHLVFVAAFLLKNGMALLTVMGDKIPPSIEEKVNLHLFLILRGSSATLSKERVANDLI